MAEILAFSMYVRSQKPLACSQIHNTANLLMQASYQCENLPPVVVSGTYNGKMNRPGKVSANLSSLAEKWLITEVLTDLSRQGPTRR